MDIKCVVCGEPWDAYGVNHGDMEPWEAKLFKAGSGCPCCQGVGNFEPQTIEDVENGDDDPMLRINAWEDRQNGKAPKWEKPEPKVFWTCDGCGVQVIGDPSLPEKHEDFLQYDTPIGAKCNQWYNSHPFWRGIPKKEPAHIFGENKVCEFCLDHCDRCSEPICSTLDYDDMYDEGHSFPHPYNYDRAICVNCLEETCGECESFSEDCTCGQEEDDERI